MFAHLIYFFFFLICSWDSYYPLFPARNFPFQVENQLTIKNWEVDRDLKSALLLIKPVENILFDFGARKNLLKHPTWTVWTYTLGHWWPPASPGYLRQDSTARQREDQSHDLYWQAGFHEGKQKTLTWHQFPLLVHWLESLLSLMLNEVWDREVGQGEQVPLKCLCMNSKRVGNTCSSLTAHRMD